MPASEREAFWTRLSQREKADLLFRWSFWARAKQIAPPGDWRVWLLLAGRGFGKTRTGAEWVRQEVEAGRRGRWAFVAQTAADVRDIMLEGESGLLTISPPWFMPTYEPSKRRITWPNGATATTYSAEDPDQLRGPNIDGAWCDELAAWKYAQTAWDMVQFTLRSGTDPRCVVTTTPRPTKIIRELVADLSTHVTKGHTRENAANLAPPFLRYILGKYEGTRLGRQELNAEILDDTPGALWKREQLDALRVPYHPDLQRIVVGVDPAITSEEGSDETGIVAAGLGSNGHGYILADESLRGTPHQWATAAVALYHRLRADCIVAEGNQGGEMVEYTIHTIDANVPVKIVHASRGKYTRAEPVAALYEQKRVHHVGTHPQLEDQQCTWVQGEKSPDRMDACVWTLTDLMLGPTGEVAVATTRTHLSPEQRAVEDSLAQYARAKALREAREALQAVSPTEEIASGDGTTDEIEALERAVAEAAEEARRVVSVRSDGGGVIYETDAERDARLQNEQALAQNLRYLESQFGLKPTGGFAGSEW